MSMNPLQHEPRPIVSARAGGLIGVATGVGISALVSQVAHWPVMISALSVILGFASAVLVGVVFGFYPARRAAALDPIVALRPE